MGEIFLLEDDKILNKGVSIALRKDGHEVTSAYGFADAIGLYDARNYDLFLLDINLPDGNGLELCTRIRETMDTPVIFLTADDTEEEMLAGFSAGCDDYISKPFSVEVLRKKVQAVLKRVHKDGAGRFHYRKLTLDMDRRLVEMDGEAVHLTDTQYRILEYLILNRGRVITKEMLLENIWDIDGEFVDDNTVRVNITRLRHKLHDEEQEYIATVFGVGYTFGE